MNRHPLKPFSPVPSPFSIHVDACRLGDQLKIHFALTGDIRSLNLPSPAESPKRVDGLYNHTCLEIFLKHGNQYLEWNFSFSGDWCIFLFEGYRKKSNLKVNLDSSLFSIQHISHSSSEANLKANLNLDKLTFMERTENKIGFSAILEHPQNNISYWALTHVAQRPDFHQEKSFIVTL